MSENNRTRRTVLSGLGTSLLTGFAGISSARERGRSRDRNPDDRPPGSGGADNERNLPVYAQGTSIHVIEPDGDEFVHRHRFESDDLAERYGDPIVVYESVRISKADVPDEMKAKGKQVERFETWQVIGTVDEHHKAESVVRPTDQVQVQTHLKDDLPLYHYESSEDASDKQNRKAPINMVWEDAGSTDAAVETSSEDCGWDQELKALFAFLGGARHINVDGETYSTDGHMMDELGPDAIPALAGWQVHVRAYDLPNSDFDVVGQAHVDPPDHNQICRFTGEACNPWHFSDAEDYTAGSWDDDVSGTSVLGQNLENGGGFDTHDGWISHIT